MERQTAIAIEHIKKVFKHKNASGKAALKTAVDDLNLEIKKGEIFGLLGPNGAGKTTTIRMLTMLTQPTEGKIMYGGYDTAKDSKAIKAMIGVVPQHINFDQDLTVGENMQLHGRLQHMEPKWREKRIKEMLEYVELEDCVNDGIRSLSGGMKRRLLIVRALMHEPQILFLDEPTVALDPQVRHRIWDLISQLREKGVTVVLTTHYIEEAQTLCDRVAIMNKGHLIALDTPQALQRRVGEYVAEWMGNGTRQLKFFSTSEGARKFAYALGHEGILARKANLEDVFVELTGRKVI